MNMVSVKSGSNFNRYRLRNISCHPIKSSVRFDYSHATAENMLCPVDVDSQVSLPYAMLKAPVSFAPGIPELLHAKLKPYL
jgi:hypothetical protein